MGAPYLSAYTTWSKGDYLGATEFQDDLAIINSYIPYRVDSAGNNRNSARRINSGNVNMSESIHKYDQDYYRFSAKKGQQLQVSIEAKGDIPMLNSELTLYNSRGAALAISDPKPTTPLPEYADKELDADLRYSIEQDGVYYLRIRGVGYNGGSNYNFSRYGAIGQYNLTVDIQDVDDDILLLIIPILKNNKEENN